MGCFRGVTQEIVLLILSSHSVICGRTPTQRHSLGSWLELVVSGDFSKLCALLLQDLHLIYYLRWDYDKKVNCFEAERKVI